MWAEWMNKEIEHARRLVGQLDKCQDPNGNGKLSRDLSKILDRLQMGAWELRMRLQMARLESLRCRGASRPPSLGGPLAIQRPVGLRTIISDKPRADNPQ